MSADIEEFSLAARVAEVERSAIEGALRATGGNRSEAARRLRIARATLYEKLAEHGLMSQKKTLRAR